MIGQSPNLDSIQPTSHAVRFVYIGLHALELAKTYWNAYVTDAIPYHSLQELATSLALAERTFSVLLGSLEETTEDPADPVCELRVLKDLVKTELERDRSR